MSEPTRGDGGRQRILLIGLDSADADLVRLWMQSGHMPNFERLRREGQWGDLGTTAEIMHVSGWPTLYTGARPGHHGMYHAYQVRAGEQYVRRTEPDWCALPPFWKHLDDAGRRCIVFDAFMDYKLPGFRGQQVLEYGTWTWFGEPASTPRGLLNDIRSRFGPYPAPEHANMVQVPDQPLQLRDQLVAGAALKARIVQSMMREQDWDMMFVTFGEPHGAGHYLWHFGDAQYPLHSAAGELAGQQLVRDVYSGIDAAIGAIADAADDRTTIIITSADGMGPNYSGCHMMPEMLHRMGLFHSSNVGAAKAAAKPQKKGLLQSLRQAVPLGLRQQVTRCMPRRMRYQLEMKWVNSAVHWDESRVFVVPNSNEGYFRVNLAGREPRGMVKPGAEYDDILGQLHEELTQLTNPVNGRRVAERVALTDAVFPGPQRPQLPDAVISWDRHARVIDQLQGPRSGLISAQPGYRVSPFYTGNHRPTAFMLARGSQLPAASTLRDGHIVDLAPSVLSALGVQSPAHHEGRPWSGFG
jgi:predicted AlkP superfamily phosphohydrolase/phosphomutase